MKQQQTCLNRSRVLLLVFCLPLLSLVSQPRPSLKTFQLQGYAQGTTYHITYYASGPVVRQESIDSVLAVIDSSLSLYKPYSLICRFNASDKGLSMDSHLKKVIIKSIDIYHKTGGLFDVTVQPLVEAWGFSARHTTTLPDSASINAILPCVGGDKLWVSGDSLCKLKSCVKIDLNGIAQGYSVDVLAAFLKLKQVHHYIVELGGELVVKGRRQPGGAEMRVGIEAPGGEGFTDTPFQKIVQLAHGALTTSGNYRKFYESGSKKISHLINPHTGYSFQNELISVTVWAKDAITADGYDNALMGMGLKKAMLFLAHQKDMGAYFIYTTPDGRIKDTATASFYRLLQ